MPWDWLALSELSGQIMGWQQDITGVGSPNVLSERRGTQTMAEGSWRYSWTS